MPTVTANWQRYQEFHFCDQKSGLALDLSRSDIASWKGWAQRLAPALEAMKKLEAGAIANPDEERMVGHYWLRAPHLAPQAELAQEIRAVREAVQQWTKNILNQGRFSNVLSIGIGGSALGPQFLCDALAPAHSGLTIDFFDNTDPDGFDRVLKRLPDLSKTLVLVISKSGGTAETFNGMVEARRAFEQAGLPFPQHAVAVTGVSSKLDKLAESEGWLARFPMWDWVGGRTSVMSAVGLLPCGLAGIDNNDLLEGAAHVDELTRREDFRQNPAALLAAAWYEAGQGRGLKDMVILPYKDRLALFSRYLQQLIMESLGKRLDRDGQEAHQGIAVYGNKGSTDQHAYVQQLRDGLNNFFATFIVVLEERQGASVEVNPGVTAGDYLSGFWQGTRQALAESGRTSVTLTIPAVTAFHLGGLIALYERAVGLYAELVNINAYHQPGVEAGKKAAAAVLELQKKVETSLSGPAPAEELAGQVGADPEAVYHILEHLAANGRASRQGFGTEALFHKPS